MRVLFLSASAQLGGAERCLIDVMVGLRATCPGWTLRLLSAAEGPLLDVAHGYGFDARALPFPPPLARFGESDAVPGWRRGLAAACAAAPAARYTRTLLRAIHSNRPALVHSNSLKMHLLASRAGAAVPVVWHLHDYIGRRPMTSRLLRLAAPRCAAIVANSQSVAADARAALPNGVPITPVLNAVDLDRFTPDGPRHDLDALSGLAPPGADIVRVGLVATFARWKGHAAFLDAIARLPRTLPLRAYVIGGPLYETAGSQLSLDALRSQVDRRGLADRVGFTGFVGDSAAAFRALDVAVHASTEPEPFGLAIAEAMACGRAVIATGVGGASELFTPGVDALTHVPGDSDDLARAILALATDANRRRDLGAAARRTAVHRFDRRRLAAELASIYTQAAA